MGESPGGLSARLGGDADASFVSTFHWPESVTCSHLDITGGGGIEARSQI